MKEKLNQVNNLKKQIELGIRTQEKMIIDIQNKKDDINFFNESLIKFQNEIIISYNNMTMVEGLLKEIKDLSMKIYKDKHNLPSMIKYNCKEDTTLTKLGQELYNKINDQTSNIKKCINEQEKIFLEFEKN